MQARALAHEKLGGIEEAIRQSMLLSAEPPPAAAVAAPAAPMVEGGGAGVSVGTEALRQQQRQCDLDEEAASLALLTRDERGGLAKYIYAQDTGISL